MGLVLVDAAAETLRLCLPVVQNSDPKFQHSRSLEELSTPQQGLQLLHGRSQSQPLLMRVRPLASEAASDRDVSPGLQEAFLSFSHTPTCLLSAGVSGPV